MGNGFKSLLEIEEYVVDRSVEKTTEWKEVVTLDDVHTTPISLTPPVICTLYNKTTPGEVRQVTFTSSLFCSIITYKFKFCGILEKNFVN